MASDSELGKKGYYSEKEEAELGKTGFYSKKGPQLGLLNHGNQPAEKDNSKSVTSAKPQGNLLPLVFLLVFIIAALSYFFFVYKPLPAGRASFDLVVTSGEVRVSNATVQVYAGEEVVAEATTDQQGKAHFASLPSQRLEFQVASPQGSSRQAVDLAQLRAYRINLKGKSTTGARQSLTLTLRDAATSSPISGLKVSYSLGSGSERFFAESDANGKVTLQLRGETVVRLRVVDPQRRYAARSDVLLATRAVNELKLQPATADKSISFESVEKQNVSFAVAVTSAVGGAAIPAGQVTMADSASGAALATAQIVNGAAQLMALGGSAVTITVSSPGFYPGQIEFTAAEGATASIALGQVVGEVGKTTLTAKGENGAAISGATVTVIPSGSVSPLLTAATGSDGSGQFTVGNSTYYALVTANGFLPVVSQAFQDGDHVDIALVSPSSDNSATLEVGVVDEDGSQLPGASVAILTDDGRLASLPQQVGFASPARFLLPLGNYKAVASLASQSGVQANGGQQAGQSAAMGQTAEQLVQLEQDAHLDLQLRANAAFLQLTALNLANDERIQAEVTSYYQGKVYANCSGFGGCTVPVHSESEVAAEVNSPGFLPLTYRAAELPKSATKRDSLHLISSVDSGLGVDFIGVFDQQGREVGSALRAGKDYTAKFFISSAAAEKLALYVRLEPAEGSGGVNNVSAYTPHLLEPPSVEGIDVAKSTVYLGPHADCVDLEQTGSEAPYAWVELRGAAKSLEFSIPFRIPSSSANSSFALRYRGKGIVGNVNARFPEDPVLGFAESSAEKADCYGATESLEFQVFQPGAPEIGVEFPEISSDFTPGDALAFNPASGQIESRQKLQSYEMQVDSILPGDALPLVLQSDSQCTILVNISHVGISAGGATPATSNADCYSYDAAAGKLVFSTRELNARCPIHLKEDKFYDAGENVVTKDSAQLTLLASCSSQVRKTIPVTVNFVSLPSFALRPDADKLGEGDAAKLLYIVNNRQLARELNISSLVQNAAPTSKEFLLPSTSTKAFSWRGPGSIEFAENDELLGEVQFADTAQAFKPGIGTLGFRVSSCAAGDVYCCSNGWCTRKAVEDLVENFKQASQKIGQGTAFRRGAGQPQAYFSHTPFKFVTVVQTVQGAQASLRAGGVSFSSPSTCLPGNPGVYQLTAQSPSGGNEWNYSAQTLSLSAPDYLQPPAANCGSNSTTTQPSLTSTDGSVNLCNFLHPVNNCVESTPQATVTSLDQVEKLKFSLTNCMYPVFPAAPVCPGNRMVLPIINIGNFQSETEFNSSNSPNAFRKIFSSISDANASKFSIFSWQGQLRCVVPPSFQQFAITAGTGLLNPVPDYAAQEAQNRAPPTGRVTSDVCGRSDFFSFSPVANLDSLLPLAGVCCAAGPSSGATHCTPRRGKFFISVHNNEVKVITQWGLTDSCYPYWPFPTNLHGLTQPQNLVSVGFGLYEYFSSNGANFELSLASQRPGSLDQPAASSGITSKSCSTNSDCAAFDQCAVNVIYHYEGGTCVGATSSTPGSCTYSTVSEKQSCAGGTQCRQTTETTAACQPCGDAGQRCCIESGGSQAFCKATAGCVVQGSAYSCTASCGDPGQPVCGGWESQPRCNAGLTVKTPQENGLLYSTCG